MQDQDREGHEITPEQGWRSIQSTLDKSRSAMYVAGWPNIMLLWGAIVAAGYFSMYAIDTLAPAFAEDYPWYPGPLWFGLGIPGMIGSSLIGHRASKQNASGPSATAAGLRVFGFWMTIVAASFIIPGASGLWTSEADPIAITGVAIGIIALGYVLFGILHHLAIALVGIGIAASFYLPTHFAGDAGPVLSASLMLAVVAVAWIWIRRA
ncbi:MAG: hypothetical protein J4G01_08675 [Dehalococcoidia bacterium]|nr:hypothetical protein [Dehalococcoidia bacterium]